MLIGKGFVFPTGVMATAEVLTYLTLIASTVAGIIPLPRRICNIIVLSIESKAFLKHMKTSIASFLGVLNSLTILLRARI